MDRTSESRIERLRRGLYSRKAPDIIDSGRTEMKKEEIQDATGWGVPESSKFDAIASRVAHGATRHRSLARKLFSFSLIVFALSLLVAGFVFWGGGNQISSKNVDIKVVGPVSVGGGQESSFEIIVSNNNSTELSNVKLTIDYPEGSRKAENLSQNLTSESFDLGALRSGGEATESLKIFIFGEKDEVKEFKATVDYNVKNSNAKFFKEKVFNVSISSSPVIVTATYPKEVNSNQDISFSVEVAPNSSDAPSDFLVNINYPFGFTLTDASPAASFGSNTWKFEGLRQGTKKTIVLHGSLLGQDNEERVFKITAGTPSEDDPRSIGVSFVSLDESITVKKPFIGLQVGLGGGTGDYVAKGEGSISGTIRLQNNVTDKIFNVVAEANLSGPAFSGAGLNVGQNGFFRSIDNTVFWDKRAVSSFNALNPGESTDLTWSFAPLLYQNFPKGSKPEIYITVKVSGDRILESGESQHVETIENRTVKLGTNLSLGQKVFRNSNGISNSGPIPPVANQKTTYSIVWSLSNSFNAVSNVSVRSILPAYVEWTGVINPNTEKITYNADTHEVVWNVGALSSGVGLDASAREAAFQVSLLPSTAQIGTAPELARTANVFGIDKVTSLQIQNSFGGVSTHFEDSSFKIGDETVR